jgi:hypothetical protein
MAHEHFARSAFGVAVMAVVIIVVSIVSASAVGVTSSSGAAVAGIAARTSGTASASRSTIRHVIGACADRVAVVFEITDVLIRHADRGGGPVVVVVAHRDEMIVASVTVVVAGIGNARTVQTDLIVLASGFGCALDIVLGRNAFAVHADVIVGAVVGVLALGRCWVSAHAVVVTDLPVRAGNVLPALRDGVGIVDAGPVVAVRPLDAVRVGPAIRVLETVAIAPYAELSRRTFRSCAAVRQDSVRRI